MNADQCAPRRRWTELVRYIVLVFAFGTVVWAAVFAAVGLLIAQLGHYPRPAAVAWTLMLGGCVVVYMTSESGDTVRRRLATQAFPWSAWSGFAFFGERIGWMWIPIGLAVSGIGVAVELLWVLA